MKNGAVKPVDVKPLELTELERVKLENFALKHNALQQQIQANLAARAEFIRQIEDTHPGHHWQEDKGLVPTDLRAV